MIDEHEPIIEVMLTPDDDPENVSWEEPHVRTPYFYCVLLWGPGPTMWHGPKSDQVEESIMPGTEHGSRYNSGICGWAVSPEAAFAEGLARYRAKLEEDKKKEAGKQKEAEALRLYQQSPLSESHRQDWEDAKAKNEPAGNE